GREPAAPAPSAGGGFASRWVPASAGPAAAAATAAATAAARAPSLAAAGSHTAPAPAPCRTHRVDAPGKSALECARSPMIHSTRPRDPMSTIMRASPIRTLVAAVAVAFVATPVLAQGPKRPLEHEDTWNWRSIRGSEI